MMVKFTLLAMTAVLKAPCLPMLGAQGGGKKINAPQEGTWAAGRTMMLRRTSKRVKEVVDKMRLPGVVRLSMSFWYDTRNGTKEAKLEFVLR